MKNSGDKQLEKRVIDLIRASENQCRYTRTNFLNPAEQALCLKVLNDEHYYSYKFVGSLCGSEKEDITERRIAVFGNSGELGYDYESPICAVRISPVSEKFADELTHRDYLGAIMNLGIDRSLTGDIVIKGKTAWVYCLDRIGEYIADNLTSVKHTSVISSIETGEVPDLMPVFREMRVNVASERIDALVAALIGKSRNTASEAIKAQKVFIDGKLIDGGSAVMKPGNIISVRGFGKFRYEGIEHETKKGRLFVIVKKYE
ncbi:MAG: YlmH/Sll1252 family protein [Lachnospiraceae bacterium]